MDKILINKSVPFIKISAVEMKKTLYTSLCLILWSYGYILAKKPKAFPKNFYNIIEKIQKKNYAQNKKSTLPLPFSSTKISPLLSYNQLQKKINISQKPSPKGDIEENIFYNAETLIRFDLAQKKTILQDKSQIKYGEILLNADNIQLDWQTNIISAGAQHKEGKVYDRPLFTQKEEQYMADELKYNFKTQQALVKKIVTKQEDGFVHGAKAKKDGKGHFYINQAKYTTCNLAKPHFYISAHKIKIIQNKKVVSGPFLLYFNDVPTPLGFFLGIFFFPSQRTSGIIVPKFGEERRKGLYIKEGGYYVRINDYMDLILLTDIYAKGSFCYSSLWNYKKRYFFEGSFYYQRENYKSGKETPFQEQKKTTIQWKHESKYNKNSSLHADVNLQQSRVRDIHKKEVFGKNQNNNQSIYSSIRYKNNFRGGLYRLSGNASHRQNLKNNQTTIILPNIRLYTHNFYPTRKIGRNIGGTWYKDIRTGHTMNLQHVIENKTSEETSADSKEKQYRPITWKKLASMYLKDSQWGLQHSIPLSTNIKIWQYFNIGPSINYGEIWYFKKLHHTYDEKKKKFSSKEIPGFQRLWYWNISTNLSTTLYGTHNFGAEKKIQGIRHTIHPSFTLEYQPKRNTYWQKVKYLEDNIWKTAKKSKFENFIYGTPSQKKNLNLYITLYQKIFTKIKNKNSSTKIPLLESCSLSTNYNFLASSYKLSDIHLHASNSFFQRFITIGYDAYFFPYMYQYLNTTYDTDQQPIIQQKKIETFAWKHGKGLGQKEKTSWYISTTFNKKILYKLFNQPIAKEDIDWFGTKKKKIQDANSYVPFTLPWNITLQYRWERTKKGFQPEKKNRTLYFSGTTNLTPHWKINFSSGYDFKKKNFKNDSTIGIQRDLHCWIINFHCNPIGKNQSYDFSIGIKAQSLKDIQYDTKREYENY